MIDGKTKQILPGPEPGTVILRAKDALTGGDAARVAEVPSVGVLRTTQAVNVFTLLAGAGVPTAFIRRLDERSMLCWDCEMLPVEWVVRRIAWGSYLLRHPGEEGPTDTARRFDDLVVERFHKHAMVLPPAAESPHMVDEGTARNRHLRDGSWAAGVYPDPYVEVQDGRWLLHPPKAPLTPEGHGHTIDAVADARADSAIVDTILVPAFACLEAAWRQIETDGGPVALVDCKFEVGVRRTDGALLLSDVVDNDSWRIWPGGDPSRQLDKQRFRDGEALSDVADSYALVTELTSRFPGLDPRAAQTPS